MSSKLSALTDGAPGQVGDLLYISRAGTDRKLSLFNLLYAAPRFCVASSDCFGTSPVGGPWGIGAIASGNVVTATSESNHPGVVVVTSHASNPNSGGYIQVGGSCFLLSGTEVYDVIFRPDNSTNVTSFIGFQDTYSVASPTDAACFVITGTTLKGSCYKAAASTDTGSNYTISDGTWYHGRITVNSGATSVGFALYGMAGGAALWSDTVASNIPTAAGQETGLGLTSVKSTAGTVNMISMDFMALSKSNLQRGLL